MLYNRPTLPATGNISRADIQRLVDDFTVALEDSDVAAVAADLGASAAGLNYFQNSDFRDWTATAISLPTTWTATAANWYARATYSGGPTTSQTVQRSADSVHDHVIYCASITGDATGVEAHFGQQFPSYISAALLEDGVTVTIELENKTGSSRTPELIFASCDVADVFSAITTQQTTSLGAIANNERKTVTLTLDFSTFVAAARRGGILYIKLPGMTSSSNEWRVYYSRCEPGTVATPRRIDRVTPTGSTTSSGTVFNYFANPGFVQSLNVASSATTEDIDNWFFGRWGVTNSDGSASVARSSLSPDERTGQSLQITGAASCTGTVDIFQDVHARDAGLLSGDTVTVSWYVYNNTGASFTPILRIDTSTADNSTSRSNELSQNMQACPNGAWTRVSLSIAPASFTAWENGARIILRIPTGSLNSNAKVVRIAQAALTVGSTATTFTSPVQFAGAVASTARTARGLVVTRPTTTTVLVEASEVVCVAPDGSSIVARNVSTTLATTGFTTSNWYLVVICCNELGIPEAVAYRESVGTFTPPDGYLWATGVVGAFYFNGSSTVDEFAQRDNIVSRVATASVGNVDTTTSVTDTYTQVTIPSQLDVVIPAIATAVGGSIGTATNIACRCVVAQSATGLGAVIFSTAATGASSLNGFIGGSAPFHIAIGTGRVLWVKNFTIGVIRLQFSRFDLP